MANDGWHIGVLGGSGLYALEGLEDVQELAVQSTFGEPSSPVTMGRIGGVKFSFIARHGAGHAIPPDAVNYRANIDALKRCGVTDLLAISAIGSLAEEMAPGDLVAVDQFIDRTVSRESSFFGPGMVAHVSMADPVCSRLSGLVQQAASATGVTVHASGTYVAIEGPQFSTRAESHLYRQWGAQVIGMTAMPEARLAREAELPYALLGMVTDYDCWREEEAGVEANDVLSVLNANAAVAQTMLQNLARGLPAKRAPSPIDTALDQAIVTAPDARDSEQLIRLGAILKRALSQA